MSMRARWQPTTLAMQHAAAAHAAPLPADARLRLGLQPGEELRVGARGRAAGAGLHLVGLLHVLLCDTKHPLVRLRAGHASARPPGRVLGGRAGMRPARAQTPLQPLMRSCRGCLARHMRAQ
jgi:hypothetical protein